MYKWIINNEFYDAVKEENSLTNFNLYAACHIPVQKLKRKIQTHRMHRTWLQAMTYKSSPHCIYRSCLSNFNRKPFLSLKILIFSKNILLSADFIDDSTSFSCGEIPPALVNLQQTKTTFQSYVKVSLKYIPCKYFFKASHFDIDIVAKGTNKHIIIKVKMWWCVNTSSLCFTILPTIHSSLPDGRFTVHLVFKDYT